MVDNTASVLFYLEININVEVKNDYQTWILVLKLWILFFIYLCITHPSHKKIIWLDCVLFAVNLPLFKKSFRYVFEVFGNFWGYFEIN